MKLFLNRIPRYVQWLYPGCIWNGPGDNKTIYLTFDDGPTPEVTEFVLATLAKFDALGTFFCLGKQIERSPYLLKKLLQAGHRVGNHTYDHINGWKVDSKEYLANVQACDKILGSSALSDDSRLFRPPYGRITPRQRRALKQHYHIVLWSYMVGDFRSINPESCFSKTISEVRHGDIVVFHDNLKSFKNITFLLPRLLEYWKKEGFDFAIL